MRWMNHRVARQCFLFDKRFNSTLSTTPQTPPTSRTVVIEDLPRGFRPTSTLLRRIKEGTVEELDYDPHNQRVYLSFLHPQPALSVYERFKAGSLSLRSGRVDGQPAPVRMGKPKPLPVKLVAGISDQNANRVLVIGFQASNVDIEAIKEKIFTDARKFGKYGALDVQSRGRSVLFRVYFYSIESAMTAKQHWSEDRAFAKAGISFASYDPCDFILFSHHKKRDGLYDRVLVRNLPVDMGITGAIFLLQPELGRFRNIFKVGEGSYAITFYSHEAASRYLDAAASNYIREPGMEKIEAMAHGNTDAKSKRVSDAAQLGATRTVVLTDIDDYQRFSQDRVREDFKAFGEPYHTAWKPESRAMHITFSDMVHASRAIHRIESRIRSDKAFSDYVEAGLSITFGPEPDAPPSPALVEIKPLRLKKGKITTDISTSRRSPVQKSTAVS
ncbi:hypothetical protein E1B28_001686 [Marasmius oreades]|uniref:RRM domain-containing protein n=1 Tax=Marasmius oreades TaxID=181124 RepID=A0A9P8AFY6_9AGAR|nr:uncharacterized protein E1B28_001686 [Marasmius oreades]KAG7099885.1 hypothetical protein E1B28_001686 [Marasmius oreades]